MRIALTNLVVMALVALILSAAVGAPLAPQPFGTLGLTPTAEPPTPVPTTVSTPEPTTIPTATTAPTAVPTAVPTTVPTSTPVPTVVSTAVPTSTPVPTAVPTSAPTSTAEPVASPVPTVTSTPAPTIAPQPSPVSETAVPVIAGDSDPRLTKRVSAHDARVGDVVEYVLTVTNHGSAPATDVVVTDGLPEFLWFISGTTTRGEITTSGRTVSVVIGSVAPQETITISLLTRITRVATAPHNENWASLTTSSSTDIVANNTGIAAITILGEATQPAAVPTTTPEAVPLSSPIPAPGPGSAGAAVPATAGESARPAGASTQPAAPSAGVQSTPARATSPAQRPPAILSRVGLYGAFQIRLASLIGLALAGFGAGIIVHLRLLAARRR